MSTLPTDISIDGQRDCHIQNEIMSPVSDDIVSASLHINQLMTNVSDAESECAGKQIID